MLDCKLVEKEAFDVIEKVEKFSVSNGENLKKIPEFWTRSHEDGSVRMLLKNSGDPDRILGICYGNEGKDFTFEYSIAAVCEKVTVAPEGFRKHMIPAREWLIFTCKGAMPNAIQELEKKIYTEFFPTSEYVPTHEMDVEVYPDGDMDSPDYLSEIWVTVNKRE